MKSKVTLILGGNRGNREVLLKRALDRITSENRLLLESSIYETEAWGGIATGPFLNQVIQIMTSQEPMGFLAFIQKVETELGRRRSEPWGDRTMDIDILFWDDSVLDTPELKVPHPFISQRKFVLEPLSEILPDLIHPTLNQKIRELLESCEDKSKVNKFKK
jgi:2-amino-4-hydroxy-6-hydroxymethyldihydropteridine diphosphokinase